MEGEGTRGDVWRILWEEGGAFWLREEIRLCWRLDSGVLERVLRVDCDGYRRNGYSYARCKNTE
jgi:hypothetical protein